VLDRVIHRKARVGTRSICTNIDIYTSHWLAASNIEIQSFDMLSTAYLLALTPDVRIYVNQSPSVYTLLDVSLIHSSDVYISSSWPFLRLRSTGSARISTPGPTRLASPRCVGKIYITSLISLHNSLFQISLSSRTKVTITYLCARPSQPKRRLIGNQFPETQHQTIHKR
jgi:hypothetical protein